VLKKNADRFKTVEDMNSPDVTVATVLGGSGHQFVKQFMPKANIKPLDTGDLTASGMEVLASRATVAIDNALSVGQFVKMHNDQMVDLFKDRPFNVLPVAWTIAPGNPRLLTFLNNMLDYMDTNGIWQSVAAQRKDTGFSLLDRNYHPLKPQ